MHALDIRVTPDGDEIDDIVYRISHDLRASVRALRELPVWLSEDLSEQGIRLEGEPKDTLNLMQSHAIRLDNMLDGLLAYSRVGRLQDMVKANPQTIFNSVLAELSPGDAPRFFAQFNPVALRIGSSDVARIFQILLSNALRHAGETPKIEITSCKSGDVWELLVSDDGPGIPDADKERVFRPMVKLVSRDEDDGGGMGLAILRKIVENYGGSVHVEDRLRRGGVTFRLRLPVLDYSGVDMV
ncbi:GHKL domain-containing protein [Alphaproteobacteria bacterium GH1-50]|uniref:histidine kinase n=1 Tax=Kangsaoukella pontilimi TaxID=2691042 RepID=A0A7C9NCI9_9RHOB|nr:ATP-binding protein [Kangsaoukella pontilimi]MXQ06719.1 GHKL domain-containing protein [Kangsaoukella pontilimi]